MEDLFSQRMQTPSVKLRYDVPTEVRNRWLSILFGIDNGRHYGAILQSIGQKCMEEYGSLSRPLHDYFVEPGAHVVEVHFIFCDDIRAIDFFELSFAVRALVGRNDLVDTANRLMRQHAIGYSFSGYAERRFTTEIKSGIGRAKSRESRRIEFPKAVRVDSEMMHVSVVEPTLTLLRGERFAQASKEIMEAHAALRHGDYDSCLTSCAAALETALKTICHYRNWKYDGERDTLSVLVETCRANGLFPPFYVESLKGIGTIRNRLGSAHGKGPLPQFRPDRYHAEHLLHVVSASILFLCRAADLSDGM